MALSTETRSGRADCGPFTCAPGPAQPAATRQSASGATSFIRRPSGRAAPRSTSLRAPAQRRSRRTRRRPLRQGAQTGGAGHRGGEPRADAAVVIDHARGRAVPDGVGRGPYAAPVLQAVLAARAVDARGAHGADPLDAALRRRAAPFRITAREAGGAVGRAHAGAGAVAGGRAGEDRARPRSALHVGPARRAQLLPAGRPRGTQPDRGVAVLVRPAGAGVVLRADVAPSVGVLADEAVLAP